MVIDTRPSAEQHAALVAAVSDTILVPTRPAILDLRAILGTIDVIKGAARRSLMALNACPPPRGAGEASLTGDARRAVAAFGVPVASVAIVNRSTFSTSRMAGLTAGEAEPDGEAAREMHALWRVVEKELDHEKANAGGRSRAEDAGSTRARAAAARKGEAVRRRQDDHVAAHRSGEAGGTQDHRVPQAGARQRSRAAGDRPRDRAQQGTRGVIDVEGLRAAITAAVDALAEVADQLPEPTPANPAPPRQADRRVNTTLRREPELLDGVRRVLALHGERAA